MAIGRSISLQTPRTQQLQGSGQLPMGAGGMGVSDELFEVQPPEGLQFVDGVTRTVYDKWSEVNTFAKTMKRNFGFDVTAPDITDPIQMQAFEAYQKGLADLYSTADVLKQSQAMLQQDMAAGAQFYEGFDPTAAPYATQRQRAIVKGIAPETQEVIKAFQKDFPNKGMASEATAEIESLQDYWEGILDSALDEGNMAMAQDARTNINALRKALYDPTSDLDRAASERIAKTRAADTKQPKYTAIPAYTAQLMQGDLSYLNTFTTPEGQPAIEVLQTKDPANLRVRVQEGRDKDGNILDTVYSIDLTDPNAVLNWVVSMERKLKGSEIDPDVVRGLDPDIVPIGLEDLGSVKIQPDVNAMSSAKAVVDQIKKAPLSTDTGRLITAFDEYVKDNKTYLPPGIPAVKAGWFGSRKPVGRSRGDEVIRSAEYWKDGLRFETEGGNVFYIPVKEEAQDEFGAKPEKGTYDEALQRVFAESGLFSGDSPSSGGTVIDSKQTYSVGGKNYSLQDLLNMGYTEDQINSAVRAGTVTVK